MLRPLHVLTVLCLVVPASTARAISFSDGTFDPGDWSVTVIGMGTASHVQIPVGGAVGEYLQITNRPTPTAGATVAGYHLHAGFVYDPSASGAIASIEWSLSTLRVSFGQLSGLAIEQGGTLFSTDTFLMPFGVAGWLARRPTLLLASDLPAGLDLSDSGAPLTFGIYAANSFDPAAGDLDNILGYDTVNIRITPIPETGPAALLGFGLVGLLAVRQRLATGIASPGSRR